MVNNLSWSKRTTRLYFDRVAKAGLLKVTTMRVTGLYFDPKINSLCHSVDKGN